MRLSELSPEAIEQFRRSTEELLSTVGFRVLHPAMLRRCQRAGARVDEAASLVCLPPELLRELLAQVPSSYEITGVAGQRWTIGGDHQHAQSIVTDPWVIDYDTGQPRRPCLADIRRHTTIAQKLPRVIAASLMDYPVSDDPGPTSNLRAMAEYVLHHDKHHYVIPASPEGFAHWLQVGEILAGDRGLRGSGLMTIAAAAVSPLTISAWNVDLIQTACDLDLPVLPTICPQAGSTSPYALAPTLLQAHAETVFLAALTQVMKPHHPFLYAVGPSVTDLRDGRDLYYTLDKVLWKLGSIELGRSYNLPVAAECGGTMTFRHDQQNAAEGMTFMLAAQSGAHMLQGFGSCYNAVGMSAEMQVIHEAWLQAAGFLSRGMNTALLPEGLASLRRAGPGGHFVTDELTLQLMRGEEFFAGELFDLSGSTEGTPLLQRAHERVEKLTADTTSPLPETTQEALRRYFHDQHAGT
jgi:trimethylamine---corrinoid protein Co-methyltransferase